MQDNIESNVINIVSEKNQRLIDILGIDLALKLADEFGGSCIYIPKKEIFGRTLRNSELLEDHKLGITLDAMRKKYNLTESAIRQILKDGRK